MRWLRLMEQFLEIGWRLLTLPFIRFVGGGNTQVLPLDHSISISLPRFLFFKLSAVHQFVLMISLIIAIFISALSIVYVKDINRRLITQWQVLQNTQIQLHNQWSQLILEASTWAAQARIEKIAGDQLGMVIPPKKNVIVL